MERIGASEARSHLPRLLNRVAQGESLTITRYGKRVARLVSIAHDSERAREAAACIVERPKHLEHLKRVPLADLMATIHEGHRYCRSFCTGLKPYSSSPKYHNEKLPHHPCAVRCCLGQQVQASIAFVQAGDRPKEVLEG